VDSKTQKKIANSNVTTGSPDADFSECAMAKSYAPDKLTFKDNVVLTIKILAIAGSLLAALWGLSAWTSAT
jgi:hypothetical protein